MSIEVTWQERTGEVWLAVDYDGLVPPTLLFDDLAMIGWRPPAPLPPPATAIDWSNPDPVAGTAYTVMPYRVTGARVEAPAGSGPRGRWTTTDRQAHRVPLRGVLARHGLALDATPASAPPRPEGSEASEESEESEVAAYTQLPPPPAPPPGSGRVVVGVTVVDAFAGVVIGRLREAGLDVSTTRAVVTRTIAFRGNRQEVQEAATRIEVEVDPDGAAAVERMMGGEGVAVRPAPLGERDPGVPAPMLHSVA